MKRVWWIHKEDKIVSTDFKLFSLFEDMILAFAIMKCFPTLLTFIIPVVYHQNLKLIKLVWFIWNWLHSFQLMYCAELYDYNIFLISTTLGDFWRKFDITILFHPYTTCIKPDFRILHQLPLTKLCCITWGLLELSKPDLSFAYWQISFDQNLLLQMEEVVT